MFESDHDRGFRHSKEVDPDSLSGLMDDITEGLSPFVSPKYHKGYEQGKKYRKSKKKKNRKKTKTEYSYSDSSGPFSKHTPLLGLGIFALFLSAFWGMLILLLITHGKNNIGGMLYPFFSCIIIGVIFLIINNKLKEK